jgi:RND family efflux transporter MFP subunit
MRRFTYAAVLGGLASGLLLSGCKRAEPPPEEAPLAPVKAERAAEAEFGEWTELIGATQPLPGRAARITAPVEGHVLTILQDENGRPIAEGQPVTKGQTIARLDDRVARAQRDKVLAALDELVELRKQADLAQQLASLEVDRLTKLNPPGANSVALPLVSKFELDKARLALLDAESRQRGVAAKEKTLRSELRGLEVQLDFYQLRAPIAGILGPIQIVPGQTLAIGGNVADVTDLAELDVTAFAAPRAAQKLRMGQDAWYATADALPDKDGPPGKVMFIAEQAQPDTGNVLVKVRFPNQKLQFRANRVARALVLTQPKKSRLTVPEAALMEDQDPPLVVVAEEVEVQKNKESGKGEQVGKARKLRAHLGVRDRSQHLVEILRLENPATQKDVPIEEALFIIEGGHGLEDGDRVKVEKHEKE